MSQLTTPTEEVHNLVPKGEHYLLEVDKPLVIPINKRIRFLITAQDVIHAFWVPDFAVKKDAIPGFVHESWAIVEKLGIYRGQCAELCGKDHGFMPIVVHAVEQDKYDADCTEILYLSRQIVAGLGKNTNRVSRAVLTEASMDGEFRTLLARDHADITILESAEVQRVLGAILEPRLYLMDPNGNIMMYFSLETAGKPMMRDFKHLLKLSNIG